MGLYIDLVLLVSAGATIPSSADDGTSQSRGYPLATRCSDLAASCTNGCGDHSVFPNCQNRSASCVPYNFMPNIDNQNCEWMDSGEFRSSPFFATDRYGFQVYAIDGATDRWILHGCDGAGIQTDCVGDISYLEHYDSTEPVVAQNCPVNTYGQDHVPCPTFYHHGYQKSYRGYSCGWWRGYASPTGIEAASGDGVGAFGPHGDGGDYSSAIRLALANCSSCAGGTALEHPYAGTCAIAYFVGAAWPWICTGPDDINRVGPYTGSDANCYCDNEPWNGRGSGERDYPHNGKIVYCGLYATATRGNKMVCDFIQVGDGSASATARSVDVFATSWEASLLTAAFV